MAFEDLTVRDAAAAQRAAPGAFLRRGGADRRQRMRPREGVPARPAGEAEARLEALQRETGVLAHDLNNLLNVILAANEAIAGARPDAATTVELAKMSQDAAEKAGALIRQLSSLDETKQAPPVDGGEAVRSAARLARMSVPASVTVDAEADEAALPCAADEAGLQSALLNLCLNAGHAMPDGGDLRLSARAMRAEGARARSLGLTAGDYIALSVSDTGVGMTADVLARATEAFFTTRRGRGGSGLGLASVRDFARRSGGGFTLASEPGRGTTATLYLPKA